MITDRDMTSIIRDWTEQPTTLRRDGLQRALAQVEITSQERQRHRRPFWRRTTAPVSGVPTGTLRPTPSPATNGRVLVPTERSLAMFSATKLVVAGVVVALAGGFLLTGVLTTQPGDVTPAAVGSASPDASASPSREAGREIVVSQRGDGDVTSIQAAVDLADDGDRILVREPIDVLDGGGYVESGLTINKDITITGDGPRERIVVGLEMAGQPEYETPAFLLTGAAATLANLTIRPADDKDVWIRVEGGTLTLRDAAIEDTFIGTGDESRLIVQNSDVVDSAIWLSGGSLVEDSAFVDACVAVDTGGDPPVVIRGNTVLGGGAGPGSCEDEWFAEITGSVVVESNVLTGQGLSLEGAPAGTVIRDNTISGAPQGVRVGSRQGATVASGATSTITGNTLTDNGVAIDMVGTDVTVAGNIITGNETGLAIGGAAPTITDNRIESNGLGLVITGTVRVPDLRGNTICGNDTNVRVVGDATDLTLDGNEVCDDVASGTPIGGTGPVLTWEPVETGIQLRPGPRGRLNRIFGHGDGFLIFDADENPYESADGLTWTPVSRPEVAAPPPDPAEAASLGDMVATYAGRHIQVTRPDSSVVEHSFRGPIQQVAVGPVGVVVVENLTRQDVIEEVFGAGAAAGDWRVVKECEELGGTWTVRTASGEVIEVVFAEHGFGRSSRGDGIHHATLGWYSPDGAEWTAIRDVALDYGIVGTGEGFYWSQESGDGHRGLLWHSADGLVWQQLGWIDLGRNDVEWGGGLLVTDGEGDRLLLATPEGIEELPVSVGPDGPSARPVGFEGVRAGGLGLVVHGEVGLIMYSPDGSQWNLSDWPAAWSVPGADVGQMVIGDEAVLVKVDRCSDPQFDAYECPIQEAQAELHSTLWRGTVRP